MCGGGRITGRRLDGRLAQIARLKTAGRAADNGGKCRTRHEPLPSLIGGEAVERWQGRHGLALALRAELVARSALALPLPSGGAATLLLLRWRPSLGGRARLLPLALTLAFSVFCALSFIFT